MNPSAIQFVPEIQPKVAKLHLFQRTPQYTLGCKRVLLSNNYYPALTQPNVEVLATGVREIRGKIVVG
jgi:cation diffusion facilitator CzcD-associated flavoprotein CzcO